MKKKTHARKAGETLLWVQILGANDPILSEQMRKAVRFLRFNQSIPCTECGKKCRLHWTMLCEFVAKRTDKGSFVLQDGKIHPPLTPVCGDHPLGPHWRTSKT
jgi:hypothetical protein